MRIEDLINEIGGRNIQLQWLDNCMRSSATNKKKVTTISFITDFTTEQLMDDEGKEAMILWVDKKKLKKAWDKVKKARRGK